LPRSSVVREIWSEAALMWRASLQPSVEDLIATQKWNAKIAAYSDALAIFLLKARRPEKYIGGLRPSTLAPAVRP
jgi:hypothetical protein